MAISWDIINEQPCIVQTASPPVIYLDQWMWGLLSEDQDLRNKFVSTAKSKNATIMYSFLNFIEFGKVDDKNQIDAIMQIMDSVDFAFSDADPHKVIDKEDETEVRGGGAFRGRHPIVDRNLLEKLGSLSLSKPLEPIKISAILKQLKSEDPERIRKVAKEFGKLPLASIQSVREDIEKLESAKKNQRLFKLQRKTKPYTRDIFRLAIFFIVSNKQMKMDSNEWIDVFHTVVPISYFDFVLLDKRWCNFVKRHCPLTPPDIAKVYYQSELDAFLSDLEGFDTKPHF